MSNIGSGGTVPIFLAHRSITQLPDYKITKLLHFFMRRMLAATVAELLQFQPVRGRLTVLGLRIVAFFALTALHRDNFSGHINTAPNSLLLTL
jgi:hypothetical protein